MSCRIVCLLALLLAVGCSRRSGHFSASELKPLIAMAEELSTEEKLRAAVLRPDLEEPVLTGKVILLSRPREFGADTAGAIGVDPAFARLPAELRAATADEAATIILVTKGFTRAGDYTNEKVGKRPQWTVVVIDKAARAVVGMQYLRGFGPPWRIRGDQDPVGEMPDERLVEYLTKLQRKP